MSRLDKFSSNVSLYEGRELEDKQQWITIPTTELRKLYFLKLKSIVRQELRLLGTTIGELTKEELLEYEKEWKKEAFAKYPYSGEYLVKRYEDDGSPVAELGEEVFYVKEEFSIVLAEPCDPECYVIRIDLDPADLADATGNSDPTFDNNVNFSYLNCEGIEKQIFGMRVSELGGFYNQGACTNSETNFGNFWYYKDNVMTVGISTATLVTDYCCYDNPVWGTAVPDPNA
jgi:hypothetical protein